MGAAEHTGRPAAGRASQPCRAEVIRRPMRTTRGGTRTERATWANAALVAVAVVALSSSALAQPKAKGAPKGKPAAAAVDPKPILEKLGSGDPARVAEGISAAQAGGAAA